MAYLHTIINNNVYNEEYPLANNIQFGYSPTV